jgi:hypothetical protein
MAINTPLFKEPPLFKYEDGKPGISIGSGVIPIITRFGKGIIPVNNTSGIYWAVPSSSNTAGKPFTLTTIIAPITGSNTKRILGIGGSPGTSFLSFYMDYSAIALYLGNTSVVTASSYKFHATNAVITLTATYDGATLSFFIDDRLIGVYSSGNLGSTTSTNLTVGDGSFYYSHDGVAILDTVLWGRSLSIDEVLYFASTKTQDYTPILQGFPSGPRIHYVIYPSTETRFPQQDDVVKGWPGVGTTSGWQNISTNSQLVTFSVDATGLTASTNYRVAFVWYDGVNYSPVSLGEIFVTSSGGIIYVRGLMLFSGNIQMVPTGSLGTGIKPLVIMTSGELKERATSEGTPITIENGSLRTLSPSETLEI